MKNIFTTSALLACFVVASAAMAAPKPGCCDSSKCKTACCMVPCCDAPCCAKAKSGVKTAFAKMVVIPKGLSKKATASCCTMPCCNGGACCTGSDCCTGK